MTLSKFVVTGCSRSGTGYIAHLLRRVGYKCGHEDIFKFDYLRLAGPPARAFVDFPQFDGDSSSGAAPFLQNLPSETIILHQVRHPVTCIRSHMGIRSFAHQYMPSQFLADDHAEQVAFFEGKSCPEIFAHADERTRCMDYWVRWNQMVEEIEALSGTRYFRYRVEDMNLGLLRKIVGLIGGSVAESEDSDLEHALASVPRSVNSRMRDDSVTWSALPDCREKVAVGELAQRYGYDLAA